MGVLEGAALVARMDVLMLAQVVLGVLDLVEDYVQETVVINALQHVFKIVPMLVLAHAQEGVQVV